jgi:hypothetical protein
MPVKALTMKPCTAPATAASKNAAAMRVLNCARSVKNREAAAAAADGDDDDWDDAQHYGRWRHHTLIETINPYPPIPPTLYFGSIYILCSSTAVYRRYMAEHMRAQSVTEFHRRKH